jgi:N-acetylglucosaminyldiphosphoundecaprenol N-acetyl-beta-D-mannosaminyltransferase
MSRNTSAGGEQPQPEHAEFLGLRFCLWSQAEVVHALVENTGAPFRYVVTPNAFHVVAAHDAPDWLLPVHRGAWLSLCDSRIIRALAKLDRRPLPLVTGSDLVAALLGVLNARHRSVTSIRLLIVGPSRPAEAVLRARYPGVNFEVIPAPGGLAQSADLRGAIARACLNRPWDILLLCVGCPQQELIAHELAILGCKSGVALCVGASIDFLTGVAVRAPLWMQKMGMEWAYRLAREPQRLWRRYLIESPKILRIFMTERSRLPR